MSRVDLLGQLQADLTALARAVKAETANSIARKSIRDEAQRIGTSWFSTVRPAIAGHARAGPDATQPSATESP